MSDAKSPRAKRIAMELSALVLNPGLERQQAAARFARGCFDKLSMTMVGCENP